MGYIRRAKRADGERVSQLRLCAYRRAGEFSVEDEAPILWTAKDEHHVVLVAADRNDRMISTTRGEVYTGYASAMEAMECSWAASDDLFPALLLGKGATLSEFRRSGLHSTLRYHFLANALPTPIRSAMGIVFEDAPRTRLMQTIGYEFVAPDEFWYTDLMTTKRTLIGVLAQDRIESACALLRAKLGDVLPEYPLIESDLSSVLTGLCGVPGSGAKPHPERRTA